MSGGATIEPGRGNDLHKLRNPEAMPVFGAETPAPAPETKEDAQAAACAAVLPASRPAAGKGKTSTGEKKPPAKTVKAGAGQYRAKADGVYYRSGEDDEGDGRKVCGPLFIIGLARDASGLGWSVMVRLVDLDGEEKQHLIPRKALLAQDSTRVLEELADMGLWLSFAGDVKKLLLQYLASGLDGQRVRLVKTTGWYNGAFVLPAEVIGDAGEVVAYHGTAKSPITQAGSVDAWRDGVARYAVGNPLLMLTIGAAFAAPLLRFAGLDSGGFHIHGGSKAGKSTVCDMAGSVYGSPKHYRLSWSATATGVEYAASTYNDLPLVLDEIGQADPRAVGSLVYLMSQGKGKTRGRDSGGLRDHAQWSCFILSNGEHSLVRYMEGNGQKANAGQQVRFIDVQVDPSAGAWPELHGYPDTSALCTQLHHAAARQHGAAGAAYLVELTRIPEHQLCAAIKQAVSEFMAAYVPVQASPQVRHAARYFALAAFAGELASGMGLTGWDAGCATAAAAGVFASWMRSRGGAGNEEDRQILRQVRLHFEQHGEARYSRMGEDPAKVDDHAPKTLARCGWRKVETVNPSGMSDERSYSRTTYYVLAESWAAEVLKGLDLKRANKLLREAGIIEPGGDGKAAQSLRMPGHGKARVYVILPALLDGDGDEHD